MNILDELTSKNDVSACDLADRIIAESEKSDTWYACFDEFVGLMNYPKSLVRNRALSILAAVAKWDAEDRFDSILSDYLSLCPVKEGWIKKYGYTIIWIGLA